MLQLSMSLMTVGMILIFIIQFCRSIWKSTLYRERSKNLTLGVVSFFAPICISLVLLDGDDINVNAHFLVFFCGLGSFVAIYFFGKAMLNN